MYSGASLLRTLYMNIPRKREGDRETERETERERQRERERELELENFSRNVV